MLEELRPEQLLPLTGFYTSVQSNNPFLQAIPKPSIIVFLWFVVTQHTLYLSGAILYEIWICHQKRPKRRLNWQGGGRTAWHISCWLHFRSIKIWDFFPYFLKWTWKSSSLTSLTCSLSPSMFNLVGAIATTSKLLFTMRPIVFEVVRSLHSYFRSLPSFRARALFPRLWLVEKYYSANQTHCHIWCFLSCSCSHGQSEWLLSQLTEQILYRNVQYGGLGRIGSVLWIMMTLFLSRWLKWSLFALLVFVKHVSKSIELWKMQKFYVKTIVKYLEEK